MPAEQLDSATSRQAAVNAYNTARKLTTREDLSHDEVDTMIHAAHASRFHWESADGTAPVNLARGEWLCSRAYAVAGRSEPSLHHGERCLSILQAAGIADWDMVCAYEAIARAHSVAGDKTKRDEYVELARKALVDVADPEDAKVVEADVNSIP